MRVLFTCQPGLGHWSPLAPLARALHDAGHEVALACTPAFLAGISAAGCQLFPVGSDETPAYLQQRRGALANIPGQDAAVFMWTQVFAGTRAQSTLPDLISLYKAWPPDVHVRDLTEFAGPVAAETCGVPHAAVQLAAFRPDLHDAIVPQLNALRAAAGLPPEPGYGWLFRYLVLTQSPPSYQDPNAPLPPTTHHIRHVPFDPSGPGQTPPWALSLPSTLFDPARPTIYATLGTVFTQLREVYQAILEAFASEPVNLILTTGDLPPDEFGPQPPHVRIERFIPQHLLLPHCHLVITHGGSGTVKDALSHGLPLVVIPIAADQHVNARRCTQLGAARTIPPDGRTPEAIRAAALDVLNDPIYRHNAARLRSEMHALPGLDHAVALLERLAAERAPIFAQ